MILKQRSRADPYTPASPVWGAEGTDPPGIFIFFRSYPSEFRTPNSELSYTLGTRLDTAHISS